MFWSLDLTAPLAPLRRHLLQQAAAKVVKEASTHEHGEGRLQAQGPLDDAVVPRGRELG